ncbi:MAG: acetamidase/formamidase family protein [Defluviitaleaceae bacterium]|nr:acetamidase/formamidase family protein [Defluviitaleaceae bacterium]
MQIQKRDVLYGEISRHNPVTMEVENGEIFKVETELNSGSWLKSINDVYNPAIKNMVNPCSGCIYVKNAKPGDMLKISIIDIELSDVGYTCWRIKNNTYPHLTTDRAPNNVTKTVAIKEGFVHWGDGVKIPTSPMIGVIGTAPALGAYPAAALGPYGGNMDVQEVTVGNVIYLPVYMEGALLHIGDVHALQGDGEICVAGGIETRSVCTLKTEVLPAPKSMIYPRLEGDDWIGTIGIAKPMEEAFNIAVNELINWMMEEYGFTPHDAVLLLGQVLEARCTQVVDPLFSYVAKVKKEYLKPVGGSVLV